MPVTESWVPLLKALADPTRLELVRVLMHGPRSVEDLAHALTITEYNVSKHLRVLRMVGLITSVKVGRHLISAVAPAFCGRVGRRKILNLGFGSIDFTGPRSRSLNSTRKLAAPQPVA